MEAFAIFGNSVSDPMLRHEVPVSIWDPCLYLEVDGRRLLLTSFEEELVEDTTANLEVITPENFGSEALAADGIGRETIDLIVAERAMKQFGIVSARVPSTFPIALADRLRAGGIDIAVDRETFTTRRRKKTPHELKGIWRALRAAEAGMNAAAALLAKADRHGEILSLEGAPLTCEDIRTVIREEVTSASATVEDISVTTGSETAVGHEPGSGVLRASEPILIDFFPRDSDSKCFADLCRTFVVGEPPSELIAYHETCHEVLERTIEAIRPGVDGRALHKAACDIFVQRGYGIDFATAAPRDRAGFTHGLGHGIGLEVIEPPWLRRESWQLVEGDVLAIEPGLYRQGFGGCRLEDLVLVTHQGAEVMTAFPRELSPP